jgi:hypothetical protein
MFAAENDDDLRIALLDLIDKATQPLVLLPNRPRIILNLKVAKRGIRSIRPSDHFPQTLR